MTRGLAHPDEHLYTRPSARLVAQVWDEKGWEMACERWFWIGRWSLQRLVVEGRAEARRAAGETPIRGYHRGSTPEAEAAAVEAIVRLGSIQAACDATGLHFTSVRRAMRDAGVAVPARDNRAIALKGAAVRRAKARAAA